MSGLYLLSMHMYIHVHCMHPAYMIVIAHYFFKICGVPGPPEEADN